MGYSFEQRCILDRLIPLFFILHFLRPFVGKEEKRMVNEWVSFRMVIDITFIISIFLLKQLVLSLYLHPSFLLLIHFDVLCVWFISILSLFFSLRIIIIHKSSIFFNVTLTTDNSVWVTLGHFPVVNFENRWPSFFYLHKNAPCFTPVSLARNSNGTYYLCHWIRMSSIGLIRSGTSLSNSL